MTETSSSRNPDTSLARDLFEAMRNYLRGWRGVAILASIAVVAGLAFNWSWLVAVGIAPVLLTALPCVAMCALGLCMSRMGGRSCSTGTSAPSTSQDIEANDTSPPMHEIPNPKSHQERRLTDA